MKRWLDRDWPPLGASPRSSSALQTHSPCCAPTSWSPPLLTPVPIHACQPQDYCSLRPSGVQSLQPFSHFPPSSILSSGFLSYLKDKTMRNSVRIFASLKKISAFFICIYLWLWATVGKSRMISMFTGLKQMLRDRHPWLKAKMDSLFLRASLPEYIIGQKLTWESSLIR